MFDNDRINTVEQTLFELATGSFVTGDGKVIPPHPGSIEFILERCRPESWGTPQAKLALLKPYEEGKLPGNSDRQIELVLTPVQQLAQKLLRGAAPMVLLWGGARSGKSFVIANELIRRAILAPGSRHAIVRRYRRSAENSMVSDTMNKLLRDFYGDCQCNYSKSDCVFHFANGSEIWVTGLDDEQQSEKILGMEFATIYFNECSELRYDSVQIALTRLAQKTELNNYAYFDCNPPGKHHWCYQLFFAGCAPDGTKLPNPAIYAQQMLNPVDNKANLAPGYIENFLATLPRDERERFLLGKWQESREGALWDQAIIDALRAHEKPELARVVIGIDPAVSGGESSDETGIIVAGADIKGDFYVIADKSLRGSPHRWAQETVFLAHRFHADTVVGEVNNGGDLIREMLTQIDPDIPFHAVRAIRSKIHRAKPAANLYALGRVHHVGSFPELEEQMCCYRGKENEKSPDRLDALVWALYELNHSGDDMSPLITV